MRLIALFSMAFLVMTMTSLSQDKVDGFTARVYKNNRREKMPYRLFIPANYDKAKKYPVIIWLHGAGGAGDDNLKQISEDQVAGTRLWTKPEIQSKHPAFVLVPQSIGGWASVSTLELSDEERLVLEILNSLKSEFNLDMKRIYLTGQSNGGFGTWDMISKRPDVFAAAIPLCGGGNPLFAASLVSMPIWAFHGDQDSVIPVSETRNMVAAIKKLGGMPRYTEYKGVDHDIWTRTFKEPGLADWLFVQHK
jgi:predicted peptidase